MRTEKVNSKKEKSKQIDQKKLYVISYEYLLFSFLAQLETKNHAQNPLIFNLRRAIWLNLKFN